MNLPGAIVRFRLVIALGWVACGVLVIPAARHVDQRLAASNRIRGSESSAVDEALRERFDSPFAHYGLLVVTGLPTVESPEGNDLLRSIVETVQAIPGTTAVISRLNLTDTLFVGSGGRGTYLLVGIDRDDASDDVMVREMRATTDSLASVIRTQHPNVALRWTGAEFLSFDLRRASSQGARSSELRALPLTLILLLVAFGAVVASVVPIVFGVLAIGVALGASALIAAHWTLSIMLQSVVSILGLALGIDYALLMISRFREALSSGQGVEYAAQEAARHAGHTVLLSGCAVAIGFTALLLVPITELRSVAIGGLLVVTTAVLLATTLLPALLVWLGPRIDGLRIWSSPVGASPSEGWRWWGRWVTRHPLLVLIVAGIPTLLLILPVLRLNTEVPRANWLPHGQQSTQAVDDLRAMDRSSVVQGTRVLLEMPRGTTALDSVGWAATAQLSRILMSDERVAQVRSLPMLTAALPIPREMFLLQLPDSVRAAFVSADGRTALLEVIPHEGVAPKELALMVRQLRETNPAIATGSAGTSLRVGGLPAYNVDYEDIIAGHFGMVILLVVSGTFVALLIGFRSVLIPLKALGLNAISVGAAYGALVLVFQDGWGIGLFGMSEPLDGVFPAVPILVFCTVFGLSMDYEVFLVARVAEARRRGMGEAEAIAEGLARTARLITSAAAIMIVIFGAFSTTDYLPMKLLGFALAVAVLVDATVVRLAIGPALLQLAGRWNWWPGEPHRLDITQPESSRAPTSQPAAPV